MFREKKQYIHFTDFKWFVYRNFESPRKILYIYKAVYLDTESTQIFESNYSVNLLYANKIWDLVSFSK